MPQDGDIDENLKVIYKEWKMTVVEVTAINIWEEITLESRIVSDVKKFSINSDMDY